MNKKELHEKYKLEDFFYHHTKENYIHEGFSGEKFTFKNGEYYQKKEGEGGNYIIDDNQDYHDVYTMDESKLSNFYN